MDTNTFLKILSSELHKPYRKPKETRKVISRYFNNIHSYDIADMSQYSKENDGYRYILVCIDVFSRYGWLFPLKTKTADEVLEHLKNLWVHDKPDMIWTDQGSEFYNKKLKQEMKKQNIEIYSTYSQNKAVIVERFVGTLKLMTYKRFTLLQSFRWLDFYLKMLNEYNNRVHSSLGMSPNDARKKKNHEKILEFNEELSETKTPLLKVGDFVRIARIKNTFEKQGYNWSTELFKIKSTLTTTPITYKLEDMNKEGIEGTFYENELQKSELGETYLVEKIIKEKVVKGKKFYLIKYLGYNDKFNTWEPAENVVDL